MSSWTLQLLWIFVVLFHCGGFKNTKEMIIPSYLSDLYHLYLLNYAYRVVSYLWSYDPALKQSVISWVFHG